MIEPFKGNQLKNFKRFFIYFISSYFSFNDDSTAQKFCIHQNTLKVKIIGQLVELREDFVTLQQEL